MKISTLRLLLCLFAPLAALFGAQPAPVTLEAGTYILRYPTAAQLRDAGQFVMTNGSYANPPWITSLDYTKLFNVPPGGGMDTTAIDTSDKLAGILGDEVGTGKLVFNTNPTFLYPASAMPADELNIALPVQSKSLSASVIWTRSATPADGRQNEVVVTNTSGSPIVITLWGSVFSEVLQTTQTAITIPANYTGSVFFVRRGTTDYIYGAPGSFNDLAAATPVAGDSLPFYDASAAGDRKVSITDLSTLLATMIGSGSGAATGDIKFILDTASVPAGWALPGANGIPAVTTPDADIKAVIKMAGIVATPTFSPAAGEVADGSTITFLSDTAGVTFMSSTSGTDPSRSSGTAGSSAVLSGDTTFEVMAYKDGAYLIDSPVASASYTVTAGGGPSWMTGLVAWWKMDGNENDSSGNGITLTNNGSTPFATGHLNQAADLEDDNSNYFTAPDNGITDVGGDVSFTIALWVKQESTPTFPSGLVGKGINADNTDEYLLYNDTTITGKYAFKVGNGTSSATVASTTAPANGVWHLVVAWHDAANDKICISINNETPVEQAWTGGTTSGSWPMYIGARPHNPGIRFDGLLDEVKMWHRVLTPTEITDLFTTT